jgi:hypothetical protein
MGLLRPLRVIIAKRLRAVRGPGFDTPTWQDVVETAKATETEERAAQKGPSTLRMLNHLRTFVAGGGSDTKMPSEGAEEDEGGL